MAQSTLTPVPIPDNQLIKASTAGDHGLTRSALYRAAQRGELTRLAPGVYTRRSDWERCDPEEAYRQAVRAVGLARPLTGRSVMALEGLPLWPVPREIDVVQRGRGHRGTGAPLPSGHTLRVHTWDKRLVKGPHGLSVPFAPALLTALCQLDVESGVVLLDACARKWPREQAKTEMGGPSSDDGAQHMDEFRAMLLRELEDSGLHRGRATARRAIRFCDGRSLNPAESRSRVFLHTAGFPAPDLGRTLTDTDGNQIRVAFHWPGERIAGQVESPTAAPRPTTPKPPTGTTVVTWRWEDLEDPMSLGQRLREAGLSTARPLRGPTAETRRPGRGQRVSVKQHVWAGVRSNRLTPQSGPRHGVSSSSRSAYLSTYSE